MPGAIGTIFVQAARDGTAASIAAKAVSAARSFFTEIRASATTSPGITLPSDPISLAGAAVRVVNGLDNGWIPGSSLKEMAAETIGDDDKKELAEYYSRLVFNLKEATGSRKWYELQKQLYSSGELSSFPNKPENALALPRLGEPLLDVTFSAIADATGLVVLDPNDSNQVPFLALELGYRARLLDQEILTLKLEDLPGQIAALTRVLNSAAQTLEGQQLLTSRLSQLETRVKQLAELIAQRQDITRLFSQTDLGMVAVPVLKGGTLGPKVEAEDSGLMAAMEAARKSSFQAPNHGLGDSLNPIDLITGKPLYFLANGTLRSIFLTVGRLATGAGRETMELLAQKSATGAARQILKTSAKTAVADARALLGSSG